MKKSERFEKIKEYLRAKNPLESPAVDVLNADFVNWYIDATGADYQFMMYGAHKCKQLSRDLGEMHAAGILTRNAYGLPGAGMGFPKWVYLYRLDELSDL